LTHLYGVNFDGMGIEQKLDLIGDIFKGMAREQGVQENQKDENHEILKALGEETSTQLCETLKALVNTPWFE